MILLRPLLIALPSCFAPLNAVVLFQLETFDSPTNWAAGSPHPNPPLIQADGGPLGTGDPALRISASATGNAGSRLAAFNRVDWAGDYLGAGISALTMDLRNASQLGSEFRIAVNGPGGWFVSEAESFSRFSTWRSVRFDLTPGTLLTNGGTDASATLRAVSELRILHNPDVDHRGGEGQRQLLIDNIRAIPEPSALLVFALGSLFVLKRNRWLA